MTLTQAKPQIGQTSAADRLMAAGKNALRAMEGEKYRIPLKGAAGNKIVLLVTEESSRKTAGKLEWSSYKLNDVEVCSLKQVSVLYGFFHPR